MYARRRLLALLFASSLVAVVAFAAGVGPFAPDDGGSSPFEIDGYRLQVDSVGAWPDTHPSNSRPVVTVRVNGTMQNATVRAVLVGPDGTRLDETRLGSPSEERISRLETGHLYLSPPGELPGSGEYEVILYSGPTGEELRRETVTVRRPAPEVENVRFRTGTFVIAWVEGCDNVVGRRGRVNATVRTTGTIPLDLEVDATVRNATVTPSALQYDANTSVADVSLRGDVVWNLAGQANVTATSKKLGRIRPGTYSLELQVVDVGTGRTLDRTVQPVTFEPINGNRSCSDRPGADPNGSEARSLPGPTRGDP